MKKNYKIFLIAIMSFFMIACGDEPFTNTSGDNDIKLAPQPAPVGAYPTAKNGDVLLGNPNYLAISYGAWRSDERSGGALVPTIDQQKEDMKILAAMGVKVIRTYNTQGYMGLDGKSNTDN
jgi:hypothetical protein